MRNYKVLGFMHLHYGLEYLKESLLSISPHVDMMMIAYTRKPSHGHGTTEVCPDAEQAMFDIAMQVFGHRLIWESHDTFQDEATHRNMRYKHAANFQVILTIDADEVYKSDEVQPALDFAFNGKDRFYGITGYVHFWRSFNYVHRDGFAPIRIENLTVRPDVMTQNLGCPLTVYHFSTCQSEAIMRYKYKIFGHANEIKPNYLEGKYFAWTPEKIKEITLLHPTSDQIWGEPTQFDKTTLPDSLKQHPNYNKELV